MPLALSRARSCAGYAPWFPTYQPWVLLAPIATIRSGVAWLLMLMHISAQTANAIALPKQLANAVLSGRPAGNFRSLSRLRFRLAQCQDRTLDLRLDLGILVDGHMINADVAAEIDVCQLAMITGIGGHGRSPAR